MDTSTLSHWRVGGLRRMVIAQVLKERLSALVKHAGRHKAQYTNARRRLRVATAQVQGWQGQDS